MLVIVKGIVIEVVYDAEISEVLVGLAPAKRSKLCRISYVVNEPICFQDVVPSFNLCF